MTNIQKSPRMTIRVAKGRLAFAMTDTTLPEQIAFEQYVAKSGVSMSANLREAFKRAVLLQRPTNRAQVLVDSPVLLVPVEEYKEDEQTDLYLKSFPYTEGSVVMSNVLPDLNAVALFAVNKDLKLVVDDHYTDVRFITLMRPVWSYLHRRSFIGNRRKLFAHFHDDALELFAFDRNRFAFANHFDVRHTKDAVYFILFVWQQLALDQRKDELYLSGDIYDRDALLADLRRYVRTVITVNPSADFNRAPMTRIKGITLDIITMYV